MSVIHEVSFCVSEKLSQCVCVCVREMERECNICELSKELPHLHPLFLFFNPITKTHYLIDSLLLYPVSHIPGYFQFSPEKNVDGRSLTPWTLTSGLQKFTPPNTVLLSMLPGLTLVLGFILFLLYLLF